MFNAFTAIETMSDEEEDEESTFSEDDEFFSPDMQGVFLSYHESRNINAIFSCNWPNVLCSNYRA